MNSNFASVAIFCVACGVPALAAGVLEPGPNGLGAVWDARYQASSLAGADDTDHDGFSNAAEAAAGTDPFDATSHPALKILDFTATDITLEARSEPGKNYRLTTAASPGSATWTGVGENHLASGTSLSFTAPRIASAGFFRVEITDADSDADGVDDWSELQLAGFDSHSGDSFGSGTPGNDLAVAKSMLQSLAAGEITAGASAATAYEKEGTDAIVTYTRSGPATYPFTLFVKTAGPGDPTQSAAATSGYTLKDGTGAAMLHTLVIPAGASSADLRVHALFNDLAEVPRHLRFFIGASALENEVTLADAAPTPENQRLLVAYLHPSPGVSSPGGGLATIRLQGDNDLSIITVSFSNLASPVTSTQILDGSSSILVSVPAGNFGGQFWYVRAAQTFTTDQQLLDALLTGGIHLSVYTESHASGEIEGAFQPTTGSTEFQVPPAPAPVASLAGSELDRDILRFLTQATYGPSPASFADMQARVTAKNGDRMAAYSAWIDEQFALPAPSLLAYTTAANQQEMQIRAALPATDPNYTATFDPNSGNRRRGWWLSALWGRDQLPQRLAFALSQIFVISDTDSLVADRAYGSASYYDMLRMRETGTYRQLLEAVSKHPMMGYYLSHLRNQKAVLAKDGTVLTYPDENYAREIMQLFSIGLVQLHPDGSLKLDAAGLPLPTYAQTDIGEMARVFTGWSFSVINSPSASNTVIPNTVFSSSNGTERYEDRWTNPMAMFSDKHDTGAKAPLGLALPAGQGGEKDLGDILDGLAGHPNAAPFICRRLIQRFVSANPSPGYLYRVANVFRNTGGNLPAVTKAILLDPEARNLATGALASSGKSREPLLRTAALLRAIDAKSQLRLSDLGAYGYPSTELAKFPAAATISRISNTSATLQQNFLSAPTVFNFYQPDYSPAGLLASNGVCSPELQIATENSVIQVNNVLYPAVYYSTGFPASALPGQGSPPYSYPDNAQNLIADLTPYQALYMAVVDANGDGVYDKLDTATFNNPAPIRAACEAVLDRADLMLCCGNLKAHDGTTPGSVRMLILDAATGTHGTSNSSNTQQATYMRDRIRAILWLCMSSPDAVAQK